MDRGALNHPLEGRGGHGFGAVHIRDQRGKIILDEGLEQRFSKLIRDPREQACITLAASGSSIRASSRCSSVASSWLRALARASAA